MARSVHVIGNGDWVHLYTRRERKGLNLTCNLAPFPYPKNHYATCIVDFKMMKCMTEGTVVVPGEWVLGYRPKVWMEKNPNFHLTTARQIKEFYLDLPKYAGNYTNFNCGHMAVHYAANKLKADRVHLYGFDSIFDFNLRSVSDFILNSDRGNMNTNRLATNWRSIWSEMFKEFKNTEFVLHHVHDEFKIKVPDNVRAEVYPRKRN
jgi:hypothetical protein